MQKRPHDAPKNKFVVSVLKNGSTAWFTPYHHREKNLPIPRLALPKIKFSGIVFMLLLAAICTVNIVKLPSSINPKRYSFQSICISNCVLNL